MGNSNVVSKQFSLKKTALSTQKMYASFGSMESLAISWLLLSNLCVLAVKLF